MPGHLDAHLDGHGRVRQRRPSTEQYVQFFDIIAPVPVITCPAAYTVSADENCEADTTPAAAGRPRPPQPTTAMTMWTSSSDPTVDGEPTSLCDGQYSFTRTWTADAMDECDNPATISCDQLITVEDTTDPTIDTLGMDLTVECDGAGNTDPLRMAGRQRRCRGQRQLQRHHLEPQRRHLERPLRRHGCRDGDLHGHGRLRQQQRARRPRSPSRTPRLRPSPATSRSTSPATSGPVTPMPSRPSASSPSTKPAVTTPSRHPASPSPEAA